MRNSSALTGDEPEDDLSTTLGAWNAMIRRAQLTDEQKLMCLLVSSYADHNGEHVHCGIATLAVDSRRGYSTARTYMRWMRKVGLIEMTRQGNRRLGHADEYRLIVSPRLGESVHVMDYDEYQAAKQALREGNQRAAADRAHRAKHAAVETPTGDLRSPKASAEPMPEATDLRSPKTSATGADLRSPSEPSALTTPSADAGDLRSHSGLSALTLDERPPSLYTFPLEDKGKVKSSADASALPEPLRTVLRSLQSLDPTVTPDEARAVHRLVAEQRKPRSTRLYTLIAEDGGFGRWLAEVRGTAAEDEAVARANRMTEIRNSPVCPHSTPGGLLLTRDGSPRCPECRAGTPVTNPDSSEPGLTDEQRVVLNAYTRAATHDGITPIGLVRLAAMVATQTKKFLAGGADLPTIVRVAENAGRAGLDIDDYLRSNT